MARTVYTMQRGPKAKDLSVEDFMPLERRPQVQAQTREQQRAVLQQWKAALRSKR